MEEGLTTSHLQLLWVGCLFYTTLPSDSEAALPPPSGATAPLSQPKHCRCPRKFSLYQILCNYLSPSMPSLSLEALIRALETGAGENGGEENYQ